MSYQTKTVCHNVGPYSRIETDILKADDGSLTIVYKVMSGGVLASNRIVLPAEVVQQLLPSLEQVIESDKTLARFLDQNPSYVPEGYKRAAPSTFSDEYGVATEDDDTEGEDDGVATEDDAGDGEPSRPARKHIVEDFDLDSED